jgi:thiopeptide-type bacteriocin biosynthesis protein
VSLGLSDQQLVFNLGDDQEAWFLLECLKESPTAVLREHLLPDNQVTAGGNPLAGQYVVLLDRQDTVYPDRRQAAPRDRETAPERRFLPGSQWLYLKLYCTVQTADLLLLEVIRPFLQRHQARISCWFFIRYADPGPHLRLRVRADEADVPQLLTAFTRLLEGSVYRELVSAVQQDTYSRELERYGEGLIAEVEQVFCAGSAYVLEVRAREQKGPGRPLTFEPFRMVFSLCRVFLPELAGLDRFFERMQQNFMAEFKADDRLRTDMDQKYRELAGGLQQALESPAEDPLAEIRGNMLKSVKLLGGLTRDWAPERRERLLADLVHMQVNRYFISRQREQELLIYYLLRKYSVSLAARQKKGLTGFLPVADDH